ncbi:MAG TPA: DNA polymerase I [Candidatus Ozemobacteraceae bacterium]|nr:DNA polymerase I [Candidatus Ozemobacteraceae bacterium]
MKELDMSGCLLVDGNNLLYRAFYALEKQRLTNRSGEPTGALFGFLRILLKVLRDERPECVGIAFDMARKTFRHQMYAEYKSTRRPTPSELLKQIPHAWDLCRALGFRLLMSEEYEADDLIGSAAESCKGNLPVRIVTGDRDLLQLIDDQVVVLLCRHNLSETTMMNREVFVQEYKFDPIRIVDYKALMGDASDNIPGVTGIGEKKATTLIQQHGSLDGVYAALEQIANPRMKQQLIEGRESAYFSYRLATIKRDAPWGTGPEDLAWPGLEAALPALVPLLRRWNFLSMVQELERQYPDSPAWKPVQEETRPGGQPHEPSLPGLDEPSGEVGAPTVMVEPVLQPVPGERLLVRTDEEFEQVLSQLGETVAIDVETDHLSPRQGRIVGFSLSCGPERSWYVPVRHRYFGFQAEGQPDAALVFPRLAEALQTRRLLGHNLKFDLAFLHREGVTGTGTPEDTMLAAYVLNPTRSNALKELARTELGLDAVTFEQVVGKGNFADVPLDKAAEYAGQDVILPWLLREKFAAGFSARPELAKLYEQLERPLMPLLLEMETTGIGLNRSYLGELQRDLQSRLNQLEQRIHEYAGGPFNVNSNKQLQEVLFQKLALPSPKRTRTGLSTDSEVLEHLADAHPIAQLLLEYRELAKLKNTYADTLADLVDQRTGLIHTHFNQTITATGRLSSSNPNLQNIPIKSEWGRKVRRAFVPPVAGQTLLSIDYSQIELRLLAHFSKDPSLVEAFRHGVDVHAVTAGRLFGKFPEAVTDEERKVGKTVNFGIIYGISAHGLARQLQIPRNAAQTYIDQFFAGYPGVTAFFERNQQEAAEKMEVSTLWGRVRPLPELADRNRNQRAFGERVARNTPLQGTAADLVKKAMLDAAKALCDGGFRTRLILQIHDELVFSAPPEELPAVSDLMTTTMERVAALDVPLVCDAATGPNLADLAPVA